MFWELSRRRDIVQRLQTELDDAMADKKVVPDINTLMRLPYLNAFLKEGKPHSRQSLRACGADIHG